ncbi:MAG: hypothetical protein A2857_02745 [Candidatus Levybacteria bacterium RIFCSPHIGHO2_01_FULL_36_15]|nr:MAG: hypothetical protein A2857_02745 [Candidatus Levybacteria bacterium RIFCSPHIGHO2_01_FULL_36_15]
MTQIDFNKSKFPVLGTVASTVLVKFESLDMPNGKNETKYRLRQRINAHDILLERINGYFNRLPIIKLIVGLSCIFALAATIYFGMHNYIVAYGDAESHLNIAKRTIQSITPGMAQIGGVWLPLPHILMIPFVYFDTLWRTGLAGSIVSGIFFVITSVFLFKLVFRVTGSKIASFCASLIFLLNPNVLYMQSTPMTEVVLMGFFLLSTYYFYLFLRNDTDFVALVLAAFFGFLATLSRYDGWLLVVIEGIVIILFYIKNSRLKKLLEGRLILFSTLAFLGIFLWLLWDLLILGDPFYFTNSQFSARTQQENWLAKGELPAYRNIYLSFLYYFITSLSNAGIIIFSVFIISFLYYFIKERSKSNLFLALVLFAPFLFYVITLYVGQSVIFIPELTPKNFEWNLFNVRYGIMMVPVVSFFFAYLISKASYGLRVILILLIFLQFALYLTGFSNIITLQDGIQGLSAAKKPDAEIWMAKNYDGGLVLLDDYARTLSIIRSDLPMQSVIYIGNKPYWNDSLKEPEKYARWIVVQKDDAVWNNIYENPVIQARLYKYFQKAYTSPEILIFKNPNKY